MGMADRTLLDKPISTSPIQITAIFTRARHSEEYKYEHISASRLPSSTGSQVTAGNVSVADTEHDRTCSISSASSSPTALGKRSKSSGNQDTSLLSLTRPRALSISAPCVITATDVCLEHRPVEPVTPLNSLEKIQKSTRPSSSSTHSTPDHQTDSLAPRDHPHALLQLFCETSELTSAVSSPRRDTPDSASASSCPTTLGPLSPQSLTSSVIAPQHSFSFPSFPSTHDIPAKRQVSCPTRSSTSAYSNNSSSGGDAILSLIMLTEHMGGMSSPSQESFHHLQPDPNQTSNRFSLVSSSSGSVGSLDDDDELGDSSVRNVEEECDRVFPFELSAEESRIEEDVDIVMFPTPRPQTRFTAGQASAQVGFPSPASEDIIGRHDVIRAGPSHLPVDSDDDDDDDVFLPGSPIRMSFAASQHDPRHSMPIYGSVGVIRESAVDGLRPLHSCEEGHTPDDFSPHLPRSLPSHFGFHRHGDFCISVNDVGEELKRISDEVQAHPRRYSSSHGGSDYGSQHGSSDLTSPLPPSPATNLLSSTFRTWREMLLPSSSNRNAPQDGVGTNSASGSQAHSSLHHSLSSPIRLSSLPQRPRAAYSSALYHPHRRQDAQPSQHLGDSAATTHRRASFSDYPVVSAIVGLVNRVRSLSVSQGEGDEGIINPTTTASPTLPGTNIHRVSAPSTSPDDFYVNEHGDGSSFSVTLKRLP